jgi:hypothetical protein
MASLARRVPGAQLGQPRDMLVPFGEELDAPAQHILQPALRTSPPHHAGLADPAALGRYARHVQQPPHPGEGAHQQHESQEEAAEEEGGQDEGRQATGGAPPAPRQVAVDSRGLGLRAFE